jgi:hypothetical protein
MWWRTVRRAAVVVVVGLLALVLAGGAGGAGATGGFYEARDDSAPPAPVDAIAAPVHDPGRPTAVVLLGSAGANVGRDVATAQWVATTLEYPAAHLGLSGSAWPWALTLRPIVIADVAIAAVLAVPFLRRRLRRRAHPRTEPTR